MPIVAPRVGAGGRRPRGARALIETRSRSTPPAGRPSRCRAARPRTASRPRCSSSAAATTRSSSPPGACSSAPSDAGGIPRSRDGRAPGGADHLTGCALLPASSSRASVHSPSPRPRMPPAPLRRRAFTASCCGATSPPTTFSRTPSFAWNPVAGALATSSRSRRRASSATAASSTRMSALTPTSRRAVPALPPVDDRQPVFPVRAGPRRRAERSVTHWSEPRLRHALADAADADRTHPGLLRWTPVEGATGYTVWYLFPTAPNKVFTPLHERRRPARVVHVPPGHLVLRLVKWRIRAVRRVRPTEPARNGLPARRTARGARSTRRRTPLHDRRADGRARSRTRSGLPPGTRTRTGLRPPFCSRQYEPLQPGGTSLYRVLRVHRPRLHQPSLLEPSHLGAADAPGRRARLAVLPHARRSLRVCGARTPSRSTARRSRRTRSCRRLHRSPARCAGHHDWQLDRGSDPGSGLDRARWVHLATSGTSISIAARGTSGRSYLSDPSRPRAALRCSGRRRRAATSRSRSQAARSQSATRSRSASRRARTRQPSSASPAARWASPTH